MKNRTRAFSLASLLFLLTLAGGCQLANPDAALLASESVTSVFSPTEPEESLEEASFTATDIGSAHESTAASASKPEHTNATTLTAGEKEVQKKIQAALSREEHAWKEEEVVLTFVGDCTIGSFPECRVSKRFETYFDASGSPTYPFDLVKDWFRADDRTVINFEGTLTTATKMAEKSWRFKGRPKFAKILSQSNVEIATLANNHSKDYLEAGYQDTLRYLTAEQIMAGDRGRPVRFSTKGMDFVILSYNLWPVEDEAETNADVAKICREIAREAEGEAAVIVCLHWGEEYEPVTAYQKRYARQIIDAGAELIIGHHPHMLQGIEQYKGKYICYSLGNFAFAGNVATRRESLETMLVRPRFSKGERHPMCTGLTIVPCFSTSHADLSVNNYRPRPVFGAEAQQVMEKLQKLSSQLPNGVHKLDTYSIG